MASTVFPVATAATGVFPTWTQLGFTNPSGLTTLTFSSLTGYKYIKVLGFQFNSQTGSTNLRLRINADSGASQYINGGSIYTGANGAVTVRTSGPGSSFDFGAYSTSSQDANIAVEFTNPTQTDGKKMIKYDFIALDGSARHNLGNGVYNSDSAITSISFLSSNGYAFDVGNGATTGFYVYGAN
jgi:hypothetical protein